MAGVQTINATEFKAKCLDILDRLATHELERVVVTKRGKPVAVLVPPERQVFDISLIYGAQRGSVIYNDEEVDLTAPVCDEIWDAELGILHR